MLQGRQIEPSDSSRSTPTVLIMKKDGSMRFYVNYQALNKVTEKDAFPLLHIDDLLDTLHGAKVVCSLDTASRFCKWICSHSGCTFRLVSMCGEAVRVSALSHLIPLTMVTVDSLVTNPCLSPYLSRFE
jgi:hypothetical protein